MLTVIQINNISTKAYGERTTLGRPVYAHMSDPVGVFDLKYADENTPHDAIDTIDILDPGAEIPVSQDFEVSQSVAVFTTGYIVISLLLSDPHTGHLRPIISFDLSIQISSSYSYNLCSQFLLVINGSTPNASIINTMNFISRGLNLQADCFNLSLTGSLRNPETGRYVLSNYLGKTVIIFGNRLNYFQLGQRDIWDFLNPWDACMLAKAGTNFLFFCPGSLDSLRAWVSQMAFPTYSSLSPSVQPAKYPADVLKKISKRVGEHTDLIVTHPVKKRLIRNLDKTVYTRAKNIKKQLNQRLPLQRYVVAPSDPGPIPEDEDDKAAKTRAKLGGIAVHEGLPHRAKIAVSLQPHTDGLPGITDYNIAMIAHSLPFKDQCAIFWNLVGSDYRSGITTDVVYRGGHLSHFSRNRLSRLAMEKEPKMDTRVRSYLMI